MSDESRTGEKALFFTLGAFIGATIALLLAPKSGEETRRLIAGKARESADYVSRGGRNVVDKTTGYVERGKEIATAAARPVVRRHGGREASLPRGKRQGEGLEGLNVFFRDNAAHDLHRDRGSGIPAPEPRLYRALSSRSETLANDLRA